MPVYTFTCTICDKKMEKLISRELRDNPISCPYCQEPAFRNGVEAFATSQTVNGAPVTEKEIDLVVGADSDKKWNKITADKTARIDRMINAGATIRDVAGPGKFNPHDYLGGEERKAVSKRYSDLAAKAVKENRDFDGSKIVGR